MWKDGFLILELTVLVRLILKRQRTSVFSSGLMLKTTRSDLSNMVKSPAPPPPLSFDSNGMFPE